MVAVKYGHLECVKILISYGADLTRSKVAPQRQWLTWSRAESRHPKVELFIQQCLQDLKEINTTRVQLERSE